MKNGLFLSCILSVCLLQASSQCAMQPDNLDCLPESIVTRERQPINSNYKALVNLELATLRALQKTFEKASSSKPKMAAGLIGAGLTVLGLMLPAAAEELRYRFIAFHQLRNIHNIMVNSCRVLYNIGLTIAAAPWVAGLINSFLTEFCANLEQAARNPLVS